MKSTVNNIQLINRFRQTAYEVSDKKEEKLFSFWMEYFIEGTKNEYTNNQFPVSLLLYTLEDSVSLTLPFSLSLFQVLLFEPHREVPNEFVFVPSFIALHERSSNSEAVSFRKYGLL